jgi:hypothetical protein
MQAKEGVSSSSICIVEVVTVQVLYIYIMAALSEQAGPVAMESIFMVPRE